MAGSVASSRRSRGWCLHHRGAQRGAARGDKGINLPDSLLRTPALTEKDLSDLDVVVRHADLAGFSFANAR
jgi:pyruvate kinase